MASDGSISFDVTIDTSKFDGGVDGVQSKLSKTGKSAVQASDDVKKVGDAGSQASKGLGSVVGSSTSASQSFSGLSSSAVVAGNLIADAIGKAVDLVKSYSSEITSASDSAQKFASTMSFAGIDDSTIASLTKQTQKYADETVYDLTDIRNTTAQLAANGVADYERVAEAAGNLNAVAGGNANTFKSVALMLTQTAGAGKLTTENWNQLADAIPGASGKLQEAMLKNGAYTGNFRDAMAKGEITADEFIQALNELGMSDVAQKAATATDTFEGAFGNLEAAFVSVGMSFVDEFKAPLTQGISVVADSLQGSVSGIQQGLSSFKQSLRDVGAVDAFKTAIITLAGKGESLFDSLQNGVNSILNLASAFNAGQLALTSFKKVVGIVSSVLGTVASAIDFLATGFNGLSPLIQGVGDWLNGLITALQSVKDTGSELVDWFMGTGLGDWVAGVADAFSEVGANVSDFFAQLAGNEDVMSALATGIAAVVAAVAIWQGTQTAFNAVMGVATAAQLAFNLALNANPIMLVITLIAGLVAGLVYFFTQTETGKQAWQSLTDFIQSCVQSIKDFIQACKDKFNDFKQSCNDAGQSIQDKWNQVMSFFQSIPSRIRGAFSDAGSWLRNAGAQIIQGLKDGITSRIDDAVSAATAGAERIVSSVKSFLGIHSPSRVFRYEVGYMIDEGLAEGIQGNLGALKVPVDNLVSTVMPSSLVGAVSPVDLSNMGGSKVSAPITVNTNDPEAAAREAVRVINFHYV